LPPPRPEWGHSRFWLGNHYATRYVDAQDVFARVRREWTALREATGAWTGTLARSGLDDVAVTHLGAQLAIVRSPTCFRAADARFFAFEGVLGASTVMWSGHYGGSCPLNCTHVWNYAQAVAAAYPELERSMRETEFQRMQAPEGYMPHRVIAPVYLRQLWGEPIGGPGSPALDGMLGTVLKTYREYRSGAGIDWLRRYWPNLTRLLQHVDCTWNVDGTGMLSGVQPSTHDIDLTGHNPFMGTLWLATLRAAEQMALLLDDADAAGAYWAMFARASASYDTPFLAGSGWGLWSQQGDQLVMACTGGRLDLRRLRVVGGVDHDYALVDGTAVSTRCTDEGIEFPSGIRLIDGQTLILAAC
jgi:non-lysosomal glucosylceramidase